MVPTSPDNRPCPARAKLLATTTPSAAKSSNRLLVLASAVLVTLCYNAALVRASPVLFQQAPDTSTKEDAPTATGHAAANHDYVMSATAEKRGPVGYVGNRFSPIGPSYSLSYPQLYADYISEMLRPRKRALYDAAYYEDADPLVIKKEMPGVLRFGKRANEIQMKKSAVPGVLRFGKRSGDIPGVLRFGKRDPSDIPGVLRFGKRDADMPGVLRFGKREDAMDMPGVLRFGKRESDIPGVLRFGKREMDIPGVLRFGKRGGDIPGVLRFGRK